MQYFGVLEQEDQPRELSGITLCSSPSQLRLLADFLLKCADGIEENPAWEHEHFEEDLNVVIFNLQKME